MFLHIEDEDVKLLQRENRILDFYSIKDANVSNSTLKVYDFKLKELPTLTKLLTLASLQGIADILSGEGIRFDEFEMKDCAMWSGVDEGSREWHNDFEDGDAFNSNILVYMDDNTEENGNNIQVASGDFINIIYD